MKLRIKIILIAIFLYCICSICFILGCGAWVFFNRFGEPKPEGYVYLCSLEDHQRKILFPEHVTDYKYNSDLKERLYKTLNEKYPQEFPYRDEYIPNNFRIERFLGPKHNFRSRVANLGQCFS